ncbi:MAG: isopenicillin-N epimerase [Actinomycetota bacterium]|jgi:isopenicillin-N epimerase|nr:isopenicillin-N epimerase [Actinomycetota bacterium]
MTVDPRAAMSTGSGANDVWGADWPEVRAMWPLEPTVAHVNHGSFGAVPTPVLEEQQSWRERMEANPVRFLARELPAALSQARSEVATFVGVDGDAIAFVPNVTTGVSTVLSAVPMDAGDQVLVTDHAYGAVHIAARRWAAQAGAEVVVAHVPLGADDDEVLATVMSAVTDRTRVAVVDQVTSPTARQLPLVGLIPALQNRDVTVLVDGAHATGMLDLELDRLGADFWTGNLHKWCCAPRGTAILYAAPHQRARLRPLVASWEEDEGFPVAFDDTGTDDPTAWLAAPRALRTLDRLEWDRVRRHNVDLAVLGQRAVADALGLEVAALPRDPAVSMQLVPLPAGVATTRADAAALQARIADEAAVEVAITTWQQQGFVRVSAHVYNAPEDYARLAAALPSLL